MKDVYKAKAEQQLVSYFESAGTIVFPEGDNPRVSIIVVTYTQTALELLCLQSVQQEMGDLAYELIISNNGTSDDNKKLLESLQNAIIIQNKENIGFVRGVNVGAARATGDYLFLLNDDALLLPGCMQALLKTIDPWEETGVGVVGGQIRTLDNKLQDAGGILWRNGGAAECYKGRSPEMGEANFLREVSYVSGACFMTPRKLFTELGGFDERFSPGYCEESDYCCRVRKADYKVIYEPQAQIQHYEYGSSPPSNVTELIREHTQLLYTKHKQLLGEGYNSDAPRYYARTTRRYSGHALIIDSLSNLSGGADPYKMIDFIRRLEQHNIFVTFFSLRGAQTWETIYSWLPRTMEVIFHEGAIGLFNFLASRLRFYDYIIFRDTSENALVHKPNLPPSKYGLSWEIDVGELIKGLDLYGKYILRLGSNETFDSKLLEDIPKPTLLWVDWHIPEYDCNAGDYAVYSYCNIFKDLGFKIKFWSDDPHWEKQNPKYEKDLEAIGWDIWNSKLTFEQTLADLGHTINVVVLARPLAINYIDLVRRYTKAPIVYYCHDLHYLREGRRLQQRGKWVSANETNKLKKLKETEHQLIRNSDLLATVSQFEAEVIRADIPEASVSVWPWFCPPKVGVGDRSPITNRILFLGGLQHSPNLDAIQWFLEAIFPLVQKEIPDVVFEIAGSYIPPEIQALDDGKAIRVIGFVENLDVLFDQGSVFVAPIRFGAGLKGKIAMAMSYGVPVVTTPLGAEGIGLTHEENVLVADTVEVFADQVVGLLKDRNKWNTLHTNSINFVQNNWSAGAVSKYLLEDMRRLNVTI